MFSLQAIFDSAGFVLSPFQVTDSVDPPAEEKSTKSQVMVTSVTVLTQHRLLCLLLLSVSFTFVLALEQTF